MKQPNGIVHHTLNFIKTRRICNAVSDVQRGGENGREDLRPIIDRWEEDHTRLTYDRIDFRPPPLACPNDVYNL